MTTQPTADQFLLGGGGKSASFPTIGTTVSGTIAAMPETRQQTDISGNPLTWENGDKRWQLVVPLQTDLREDPDDDGIRNLYVKGSKDPKSQSLHAAVASAVQAAGAKGLELGGTLTVTYVGDGVASTRGFNPPKKYQATYQRPDASQASGDFLGTAQPSEAPAQQQSPAQQQPSNAGQPTAQQVAALKAAGLADDKIREIYPGYTS
jgi:hypothetical protein